MAKAKENDSNTVYRAPKEKGIMDFVSPEEAIKDIVAYEVYDAESAGNQLDAGEQVASEKYVYAKSPELLKDFEQLPETEDLELTPAPVFNDGDTVIDAENARTGVVFTDAAKGQVKVMIDGKNRSVKLSKDWSHYTPTPEQLALAKADEVLVESMTDEERQRLYELEEKIKGATEQLKQALFTYPMQIGEGLAEISENRLYREFYGTLEEYAKDKFDISRGHAHKLISTFKYGKVATDVLTEVQDTLQLSDGVQLSLRATDELVKGANRIAESLGLGAAEFNLLKPVIDNTIRILVDTAPKNDDGSLSLTQPVIAKYNEVLENVIKTNLVDVDGTQKTIEEAVKDGTFALAVQDTVITSVAEGLMAKKDYIIQETKKAFERQTTPVVDGGKPDEELPLYKGKLIPEISGVCSKHGTVDIINIGNGTLQTSCQCRGRIDADSGKLVCFETEGKRIVVEKLQVPSNAEAKAKGK